MMGTLAPLTSLDDTCFIARRVLAMLRDSRSNAERVARMVEMVPPLADRVIDSAHALLAERETDVASTAHAVALMGFRRVEGVVRGFLYSEFDRHAARHEGDTVEAARLLSARARARYAAV